jgi:hypothetical protein
MGWRLSHFAVTLSRLSHFGKRDMSRFMGNPMTKCPQCKRAVFGPMCLRCERVERMGITATREEATGAGAEPVSATPQPKAPPPAPEPEPSHAHVHASAHTQSVTTEGSENVTCIVCHKPFIPKRRHAKTCSPKCRKQASRLLT